MGKTLKDLKDDVTVVSVSNLEKAVSNTFIGNRIGVINKDVREMLSSKRGDVSIPTMQKFLSENKDYANDLENLYIKKMQGVKGYDTVDVATMITQAALFDNLCFVYDAEKEVYSLVTMNFELLYNLDIEYDMLKQVYTKNKRGIVKAYRIDVEYLNSSEEFTFKAVNARDFDIDDVKSDWDETKRFFLVPYPYIVEFMKIFDKALYNGKILKFHQAINGIEKVRFVTKNKEVLAEYCDDANAVNGLTAKYFPLKGFFYAPVLGAASTTAMVTNINIFDMFRVKIVSKETAEKSGVHKPENPIKDLFAESIVCNKLMAIKNDDIAIFSDIINSLPYRKKYLAEDVETISSMSISKYLHSVTEASKKTIYKALNVNGEINSRMSLVSSGSVPISEKDMENIEELLKQGICKFTIQKKDCRLGSIFCTNNKEILSNIYGNDYVKRYEGFSTKFYLFCNDIKTNGFTFNSVKDLLDKYGFVNDVAVADKVYEIVSPEGNFEDELKPYLADVMGINLKRSQSANSGDSILARSLTAFIDENGKPVDFYKNVDKKKILSGLFLK